LIRYELMLWITWDNAFQTTAPAYTGDKKLNSAQTRSRIRLYKMRHPSHIVTGHRWRVIK